MTLDFFLLSHVPPDLTLFPYTTLFRSPFSVSEYQPGEYVRLARNTHYWKKDAAGKQLPYLDSIRIDIQANRDIELTRLDRKSTRLNSSHVSISYAVFWL